MQPKLDPIVAEAFPPASEPWPYWGPALILASVGSWGLVLAAAKLVAALV